MHLQILASGSRGNSLLVRAGELHLLIDAGLPLMELEERLAAARVSPRRLDAIALTHGHLDHARSAGRLGRRGHATIYCSEKLMGNRSVKRAPRLFALRIDSTVEIEAARGGDRLSLLPVKVPHDADPTVAFRFEHGGRVGCLLTDVGHPQEGLERRLGDAHLLVLEFNHDAERLRTGDYSPALKARIRGPRGHLSNDEAAVLLERLVNPRLHTVVLAHLSRENNTPDLAVAAGRAALVARGREDVRVLVASQDEIGPNLEV